MKPGLEIGALGQITWTVAAEHTITLGPDGPRPVTVFSTPSMIMLMERAARETLRPLLAEGEESVGVSVQVEHLAGAPIGAAVRGVARVTAIDGRKIDFEIEAYEGEKLLGRGKHRRAVVLLEKIAAGIGAPPAPAAPSANAPAETPRLATLEIALTGPVAEVVINRPHAANAMDGAMTGDLERLVAWLAAPGNPARVVIFTGKGNAFCAGDDVKEVAGLSPAQARALSHRQARAFHAFETLPQVLIAAVNGHALGAGCVWAYSCDFRVAAHQAAFGMPEIKLGWPPGYGVAPLTALVGKARALDLCLTGRSIPAPVAVEWGLAHESVPAGNLLARARALARDLAAMPPLALAATKRLVHADEGPAPKHAYLLDTEAYVRCFDTADAREGMAAFREKRPPKFTGR